MRFFLIISFLTLIACQKQSKSYKEELNKVISKVDTSNSFNGYIGILTDSTSTIISHGYRSPLKKQHKLSMDDRFHIASNSKLFTGLTVLKLMEEFNLKPTDSIATYFPELHSSLRKVTIAQLANHTSAIHDFFSLAEKAVNITNEQAFNLLTQLDSTVYTPGEKWGYTNSGYLLLSLLVERVSGKDYNTYLKEKALAPLGLEKAELHPNPKNVLNGYINGEKSSTLAYTTGGSGIYLTTKEIIEFFKHQNQFEKYWLQAEEYSSAWTDPKWRYGFGWFFSKDKLGKFKAHSGRSGGFESYFRIYENGTTVFILSNHEVGLAKPIRKAVLEYLKNISQKN